jgi:mannonate dehydratase
MNRRDFVIAGSVASLAAGGSAPAAVSRRAAVSAPGRRFL